LLVIGVVMLVYNNRKLRYNCCKRTFWCT